MDNNIIFNKLLHLTGLTKDEETLVKLFEEQNQHGVTASKIKGWRTSPNNARHSPMPDVVLEKFIQGLFALRNEAESKDISLFDCTEIYPEIRK